MKQKSFRFLSILLCVVLLGTGLLSGAAFLYDPQNVYRWNTVGKRYYHPIYSAAGSIANYEYDTLILGSSMVQNWDADTIAEELHCRPLKVTVGAMAPSELLYLYLAAQNAQKAERMIINIDLHRVASTNEIKPNARRFPAYQFDPHGLTQFQYLLGFNTWFKFIPTDVFFTLAQFLPLPNSIQSKIEESTNINTMCYWDESITMSAEQWQETMENGEDNFNEGDNSVFSPNATENMESFLQNLLAELRPEQRITFFLPPYSLLYWHEKTPEQLETLLLLRERLATAVSKNAQLELIDMQWIDETKEYTLYVDANHSGQSIRKMAERSLAQNDYKIKNLKQMQSNNEQICRSIQELVS